MIYLTGDTHGELDVHKLGARYFHAKHLTKDDYVIVLGDFGFIWDREPSNQEQYWLRWFDDHPWTTLFVDGNHENHPRLKEFPEEEWHGGRVHRISKSVYHLMRGQVYELEGRTFFVMGGAQSSDILYRKEGISWWPEELPSEEEYAEGIRNLEARNWQVDYVLTHDLPTKQLRELNPYYEPYVLTDWLNGIRKRLTYRHWFCGHHHVDRELSDNVHILYDRVLLLEDEENFQSHSTFEQIQLQPGDDINDEWEHYSGGLSKADRERRAKQYEEDLRLIAEMSRKLAKKRS